jgi:hypothetical protein
MTEFQIPSDDEEKTISIDVDDAISQGAYANLAISNFNQEEFILDFVFVQPNGNKGKALSRIILSPRNAKRLAEMLIRNVSDYEKKLGPIVEGGNFPGINLSIN